MARAEIADFCRVTDELGPDELQHLFLELHISQRDIEHAEKSADTSDTRLQAVAVLSRWKQLNGSRATCETLLDARKKVLELGQSKAKVKEKVADFNLKECQDQLRELYLGPEMKVQLTPWIPEHAVEMDAIFVNLELVKDQVSPSEIRQIPLERNEDLVTMKTMAGSRVNRILIQGEAGSGKSTLLDNIAYKWALQLENGDSVTSTESPLSQFDLVFILSMHKIEDKSNTLEEIIFSQILEESANVSKDSLKSYLKSNAKNCLFLIDGLDEDNAGILSSTEAEMSRLLYNKIYKQSCVIASARTNELINVSRKMKPFTNVKLTGLSAENIVDYILNFFEEDPSNSIQLLNQLIESQHLSHLAKIPLLLLFFCLLWNDPDQDKKSLPDTRTKLYQETVACLWKRYHYEKMGSSEEYLVDEKSQLELTELLNTLGKVSLVGMLDQSTEKVLFNTSDFEENSFLLALGVGILKKDRFKSTLHMKTAVKFLHTSFQDFCSAVYLSYLQCEKNEECKKYVKHLLLQKLHTPYGIRTADVFIFCAGCKPETTKLIISQMVTDLDILRDLAEKQSISDGMIPPLGEEKIKLSTSYIINWLFQLVLEAQLTYEQCNELVSIMSSINSSEGNLQTEAPRPLALVWNLGHTEKYVEYQLNLLKPVTAGNTGLLFSTLSDVQLHSAIEFPRFYPLVVSMLMYTKQLKVFKIVFEFDLQPNQLPDLSQIFDTYADMKRLEELCMELHEDNPTSQSCNVDVSNSLHKMCHLNLKCLHFENLNFTAKSMANYILCSNKSLNYLTLVSKNFMSDNFSMVRSISKLKHLVYLKLGRIRIGRAVKCLESIIPQLTLLALLYPCLDAWDIYELASYLQRAKMLKTLGLCVNSIGSAIIIVADQLKHMVNLEKLQLCCLNIGNSEVKKLVHSIEKTSSLCFLDLRGNPDIGLEGRQALESLHALPQFQRLDIQLDPESNEISSKLDQQQQRESETLFQLSTMNPALLPYQILYLQKRNTDLEQQEALLPDCPKCMSQIYKSLYAPSDNAP